MQVNRACKERRREDLGGGTRSVAKKVILGAILGGLVYFVWGAVSWMALPWHNATLHGFKDPQVMKQVIVDQTVQDGMYVLPCAHAGMEGKSPEEVKAAFEEAMKEKSETGPFIFASVRRGPSPGFETLMPLGLLSAIITAGFITYLLLRAGPMSFLGKVSFVKFIAVVICLSGVVPNWIWWHYSADFVLVDCLDRVIGWGLASIPMALVVGKGSSS